MSKSYRPATTEQGTLLIAIRVDDAQDADLRRILRGGADWRALRRLALSQDVLPLLYMRLKRVAPDLVPPAEMAHLRTLYLASAGQSLRLAARLRQILELLGNEGIAALPFKGPALAMQAYGDLTLRQVSTDLDIVIHKPDFPLVRRLLLGAGYGERYPLSPKRERWLLRSQAGFAFHRGHQPGVARSPDGDIPPDEYIDVHWSLADNIRPLPVRADETWRDTVTVSIGGVDTPTLSPGHTALLLCEHGDKHAWGRLRLIADLAHLLHAHPGIDSAALWTKARATRLGKMVALGLYLAHEVGGAPLPDSLPGLVGADPSVPALAERIRSSIFVAPAHTHRMNDDAPALAAPLPTCGWFYDRLLPIWNQLFQPKLTDWQAIDLPDALYGLYYVIRPLRLLAKYGARVVPKRPPS